MIPHMLTLGVRFDVKKSGGGYYGLACWKVFWQSINPEDVGAASLYEGDTAATIAGRENVFCIAVQSSESATIAKIKHALIESESFKHVCATPMFIEGSACFAEPLPAAGEIDAQGSISGRSDAPRSALVAVRAARASTGQSAVDAPIIRRQKPPLKPKSQWEETLNKQWLYVLNDSCGEKADLRGQDLCRTDLQGVNLQNANLCGARFCGSDLSDANLSGALLMDADLGDADLCATNLSDASLMMANLRGADLRRANLRGADLSGARLPGANLAMANLHGASLQSVDFTGADLHNADLSSADLLEADLRTANLRGAILSKASLCEADLRGADLTGADLRGANLSEAELDGADLTDALLSDT